MNPKNIHLLLIPADKIQELIQIEPALVLLGLVLLAGLLYKIFMREVSEERHRILRGCFKNITPYSVGACAFFLLYLGIDRWNVEHPILDQIMPYVGLCAIILAIFIFVKVCRLFAYIYLFLSHMKVAVPLLVVNLFTLILSSLSVGWLATEIFNIRLAPILATSAILSLVLGLALQDLLGNLFSGVALQFDKPYEIGDWIEVQHDGQKWAGQVNEISWRATLLTAIGEELITIPNRVMGQAEIANFAAKNRPIFRNQLFKVPHHFPRNTVKKILLDAVSDLPGIEKDPGPLVLITELNESWIGYKLIYTTTNYGSQFVLGDSVLTHALEALEKAKVPLASQRIQILNV